MISEEDAGCVDTLVGECTPGLCFKGSDIVDCGEADRVERISCGDVDE